MNAQPSTTEFVTTRDIAARYKISETTVKRWAYEGKIPCVHFEKTLRFDLAAVIEAIEGKKP